MLRSIGNADVNPAGDARDTSPNISVGGTSTGISPNTIMYFRIGWWCGTVVERRSLAGELSLSCARPAADG